VAREAARKLRSVQPAERAWRKIAAPLRERLGVRVLFFGITGSGKTTGVKDFLRYLAREHLVELTLIHDVKKPLPQYEGEVIHEAREIYEADKTPESYPATRVLRRRGLDHMPSVEGAARVTMECGYNDVATMLVVDEFQRGLTDGGKFESASLRRIFCEGYGLHASIVATKQLPQFVPTEATGQSAKVYFRLTREGTNFLADEKKIPKDQAEILTGLDVGQFTLVPEEGDFDGMVYQVPPP
jgi:hypothetical protein